MTQCKSNTSVCVHYIIILLNTKKTCILKYLNGVFTSIFKLVFKIYLFIIIEIMSIKIKFKFKEKY